MKKYLNFGIILSEIRKSLIVLFLWMTTILIIYYTAFYLKIPEKEKINIYINALWMVGTVGSLLWLIRKHFEDKKYEQIEAYLIPQTSLSMIDNSIITILNLGKRAAFDINITLGNNEKFSEKNVRDFASYLIPPTSITVTKNDLVNADKKCRSSSEPDFKLTNLITNDSSVVDWKLKVSYLRLEYNTLPLWEWENITILYKLFIEEQWDETNHKFLLRNAVRV